MPAVGEGPRAEQLRAEYGGTGLGDGPERTELPRDSCHPIRAGRDVLVAGRRQRVQASFDRLQLRPLVFEPRAKGLGERPAVPGLRGPHLFEKVAGERQPHPLGGQHALDPIAHPLPILAHRLDLSRTLPLRFGLR